MFVRFVVAERDPDSDQPKGIFQATRDLLEAGLLSEHEERWADEVFAWLAEHLSTPARFAGSRRAHAPKRAISWFRATATEHIAQSRGIGSLLRQKDIEVEMLTTERPGYVVYEDEHQVVALPFGSSR